MDEDLIKKLVILWRNKGETPNELYELANLINEKQNRTNKFLDSIDVCGTGGDKTNTFNISTLAAIVASSCGAKVIKHSGRSTTSITGSVDILNQFGFEFNDRSCLKQEEYFLKTGLMFTSSKLLRELFGDVKKVCKKLDIPGFVNLLGPLTNPYETSFQLLGVSSIKWGDLISETLRLNTLNKPNVEGLVVCCEISENQFLDELSFCGLNHIWKVKKGEIKKDIVKPQDFSVEICDLSSLIISNQNEAKTIFEGVLKGNSSENLKAKVIALNVGAILSLVKQVESIQEGYKVALEYIKTGKSWEHFQGFINCNK